METVSTHIYAPDEEDCLLFHDEFTGLVRKDKIIEDVDMRSDMLCSYVDDDFRRILLSLSGSCLRRK